MKFQIGDRVIGIGSHDNLDINGRAGTIAYATNDTGREKYGVYFDERFNHNLHDLNGRIDHEHGWYVTADKLELVEEHCELPKDAVLDFDAFRGAE